MQRHYIQCAYRQGDKRSYTFHIDGERPAIGERMKTMSKENDGSWVKVWVTGIVGTAPSFPTKAVQPNPVTPEERAELLSASRPPLNETPNAEFDDGPGFDD